MFFQTQASVMILKIKNYIKFVNTYILQLTAYTTQIKKIIKSGDSFLDVKNFVPEMRINQSYKENKAAKTS